MDLSPLALPQCRVIDPALMPGVARGHVDGSLAAGRPYVSTASWVVLCRMIAGTDLTNMCKRFEACEKKSPPYHH